MKHFLKLADYKWVSGSDKEMMYKDSLGEWFIGQSHDVIVGETYVVEITDNALGMVIVVLSTLLIGLIVSVSTKTILNPLFVKCYIMSCGRLNDITRMIRPIELIGAVNCVII